MPAFSRRSGVGGDGPTGSSAEATAAGETSTSKLSRAARDGEPTRRPACPETAGAAAHCRPPPEPPLAAALNAAPPPADLFHRSGVSHASHVPKATGAGGILCRAAAAARGPEERGARPRRRRPEDGGEVQETRSAGHRQSAARARERHEAEVGVAGGGAVADSRRKEAASVNDGDRISGTSKLEVTLWSSPPACLDDPSRALPFFPRPAPGSHLPSPRSFSQLVGPTHLHT